MKTCLVYTRCNIELQYETSQCPIHVQIEAILHHAYSQWKIYLDISLYLYDCVDEYNVCGYVFVCGPKICN